ncbi:hypothetical protein KP509_11G002200 [Ceratopteris richardii]|nr:hypothetical protein KP509_11G002200 [Ceratopteris richardii]KAH7424312.1 hypothetical protein KP509_11G002200 [Ceratopteris richardii]KAH7424313.1 hypothetical protein KP509_11G002200 [Ceratopteris richardii]
MLNYSAGLRAEHDSLINSVFMSKTYVKLYSYTHVLNGFAVQLTSTQADALRKLPRVQRIEADQKVEKLTTYTPDYLRLPTGAWLSDGGPTTAGEGVVIGIIDTGIDPRHPSFNTNGSMVHTRSLGAFHGKCENSNAGLGPFCNGKIIAAQHFGVAAQAAGALTSSNDFASPLDVDGHGSHTASIAAGNHGVAVNNDGFTYGEASGMAPGARISVYKALYRHFGGFMSDVVAAIDQAAKDGVDVLSLSVGPSSPSSNTHLAFLSAFDVALLSAVRAGIFVVQAAGNGGPYPRTMTSFSPWIMSVAAGLDDRYYENLIYLGNGIQLAGAGLAPATPGDQMYDLALAEDALLNNSFSLNPSDCQQSAVLNKTLLQGKILLCSYSSRFIYGGSSVKKVAETARNLSAAGFVLYVKTDLPGIKFSPTPLGMPGIVIIDVQDSLTLMEYYKSSSAGQHARARIGNGMYPSYQGTAPQVALFSSRGPAAKNHMLQDSDILKPDILAPGSLIWGAWTPLGLDEPAFQGQHFAMISGTSMAAPHIAGIAALIKQAHRDWSPAAIASAMVTSASITDSKGEPLLAQHYSSNESIFLIPATPFDFGGGAINASAALDPGLVFEADYEDYIAFLCSVARMDQTEVIKVTGSGCNAQVRPASDLNSPSITISNLVADRTVVRTVTNVAGTAETYEISYVEPVGVSMEVSPRSFTIQTGESVTFSVLMKLATDSSSEYSFGSLILRGSRGHLVRVHVSVRAGPL